MGRGRVKTQTSPGSTNYLSKFTLLYRISRSSEPLQETQLLHGGRRPRLDDGLGQTRKSPVLQECPAFSTRADIQSTAAGCHEET